MSEQVHGLRALPVLRPDELLRRPLADLIVEDGAELHVHAKGTYADYFARVHVNSVVDLQTLGFVPRGLREETLKQAVKEDDKTAYETARQIMSRDGWRECSCEAKSGVHSSHSASLLSLYRRVRRTANPALAALLSDHQGAEFRWDSIHVQSVKGWLDRASDALSRSALVLSLFNDICIGRQSRLVLDSDCVELFARGIYIHRSGTLVHRGGYLRIWAGQIARYEDWLTTVRDIHIPWALAQ